MKPWEIINLASKIIGLYLITLLILDLQSLIFAPYSDLSDDNFKWAGQLLLITSFKAFLAWFFITKSSLIARWLVKDSGATVGPEISNPFWLELVIIFLGGEMVLSGVPDIAGRLLHYIFFNEYGRLERSLFWSPQNKSEIFISIFSVIVGLYVVLKARTVSIWLTKRFESTSRN